MSASGNWNIAATDFPTRGTPRERLEFALKQALLASTACGWQPGRFHVTDQYIELFANRDHTLDGIYPDDRELMIHCGFSLICLKLAMKRFDCLGRVELFPDLGQPFLVARVHCGCRHEHDSLDRGLFDAMTRSPAYPSPLGEPPVYEATLETLRRSVVREPAWLEFARNDVSRRRLLDLVIASQRNQAGAARAWREFDNEAGVHDAPGQSGMIPHPIRSRISQWAKPLLAFKVRRADSDSFQADPGNQPVFSKGTLAVLKTKTDEKHGWVATGKAMARVILQAQALGLSWSFSHHAMRSTGVRTDLRTGIGHKGFAQAILRFGSDSATAIPNLPTLSHPVTTTATLSS